MTPLQEAIAERRAIMAADGVPEHIIDEMIKNIIRRVRMSDNPLDVQIGGDHYKDMAIQPIEFLTRNKIEFIPGCVIKRMCRYRSKNGLEDLLKARHEINVLISLEYGDNNV